MAEPGIADPVAAPIAAPAPAPAPVVPVGSTYDPDTHVLVPKEQLSGYDGRFGGVMRDAKAYADAKEGGRFDPGVDKILDLARQNNMTTEEVYAYITSDGTAGGQQQQYDIPGQQPAGQQPPVALTEERMRQVLQEQRQEDATARQAADADSQRETAFASEREGVTKVLRDEFKYTFTADGQPDGSKATVAQQLFNSSVNQVMKGDVPDWLSGEDRAEALRAVQNTPATSGQIKRAADVFKQLVDDFKNDAVAEFAKGQAGVPNNSLSSGGSGPVSKDPSKMTYEEKVAELSGAVRQASGRNMDGSPA